MSIENIYSQCFPERSYSGTALAEFLDWRDETANNWDGLILRVSSELVFVALSVANCIEAIVMELFWLIGLVSKEQFAVAACSYSMSIDSVIYNPFRKQLRNTFKTPGEIDPCSPLSLSAQEKTLLELKHLSHWFELKGTVSFGPYTKNLEGLDVYLEPGLCKSVSNALKGSTYSNNPALSKVIDQTLFLNNPYCIKPRSEKEAFIQRVKNGKLCLLKTGWQNHSIGLAFFGDYMAIANGGSRPQEDQYVTVYKIDPSKITLEILNSIEQMKMCAPHFAINAFFQNLPTLLSPTKFTQKDALCQRFERHQPPPQIAGNCSLYSLQALLPFATAMLKSANPSEQTIRAARDASARFNKWAALQYGEQFHPEKEINDPKFHAMLAKAKQAARKQLEKM